MKKLSAIFFMISVFTSAQPLEKTEKKQKTVYKKYTEFDFAGETVEGKSRTPELFYIFQRKRSGGHEVVNLPENFLFHREETVSALKEALQ